MAYRRSQGKQQPQEKTVEIWRKDGKLEDSHAAKSNETQKDNEQAGKSVKDLRRFFEMMAQNKETDQFKKEKCRSMADLRRIDEIQEDKKQDDQFLKKRFSPLAARVNDKQDDKEWAEPSIRDQKRLFETLAQKKESAKFDETQGDKEQAERFFVVPTQKKETDQFRKEKRWSMIDMTRINKVQEDEKQDDQFLRKRWQSMKDITTYETQEEKKQAGYFAKEIANMVEQSLDRRIIDIGQSLDRKINTLIERSPIKGITSEMEQSLTKKNYEKFNTKNEQFLDKEHIKKLNSKIEELQKELENRKAQFKSVWRIAPLYPDWRKEEFKIVNLTLDETTAHPNLLLSEKRTQVTWQEKCQDVSYSTERFDILPCVLGQLNVTSGRVYWEVKVDHTGSWDLGVCRDDVTRKGRVNVSPRNGFWCIRLYDGEYWALSDSEIQLTLKAKPHHIGIFLDIEDGGLSFFNMKDNSHIFSFPKCSFSGTLRPYLRLRSYESGPITTVQVKEN